jgi:hypothetical protein
LGWRIDHKNKTAYEFLGHQGTALDGFRPYIATISEAVTHNTQLPDLWTG